MKRLALLTAVLGVFALLGALAMTGCDGDSTVTPPPVEDCTDGEDNDGDTLADCDDDDCATDPTCYESDCEDGIDQDGDTFIDCDDEDCYGEDGCCGDGNCDPVENACDDGLEAYMCPDDCGRPRPNERNRCENELDDDCDGCTDAGDSDCGAIETDCDDEADDDCDGDIDCDDRDCEEDEACVEP
jgi:hypothetical protein